MPPTVTKKDVYISPIDVSKILGICPRTVNKYFDCGVLKGFRLPSTREGTTAGSFRKISVLSILSLCKEGKFPDEIIQKFRDMLNVNKITDTTEFPKVQETDNRAR